LLQLLYLILFILDGRFSLSYPTDNIRSVNGQGLFQILEDIPIINNKAVYRSCM